MTKDRRSEIMRSVGRENTGPEIAVRSVAHKLGYRYRLHYKNLPGSPDIVFPGRRKLIFVHGCFWHGHKKCRLARTPKTNTVYWADKIRRNRKRDRRVVQELSRSNWDVLVIWECQTRNDVELASTLTRFLDPPKEAPARKEVRARITVDRVPRCLEMHKNFIDSPELQAAFRRWLLDSGIASRVAGDYICRCRRIERELNVSLVRAVQSERPYVELMQKIRDYATSSAESASSTYSLAATLRRAARKFAEFLKGDLSHDYPDGRSANLRCKIVR